MLVKLRLPAARGGAVLTLRWHTPAGSPEASHPQQQKYAANYPALSSADSPGWEPACNWSGTYCVEAMHTGTAYDKISNYCYCGQNLNRCCKESMQRLKNRQWKAMVFRLISPSPKSNSSLATRHTRTCPVIVNFTC